jgi:hypothetical protein
VIIELFFLAKDLAGSMEGRRGLREIRGSGSNKDWILEEEEARLEILRFEVVL